MLLYGKKNIQWALIRWEKIMKSSTDPISKTTILKCLRYFKVIYSNATYDKSNEILMEHWVLVVLWKVLLKYDRSLGFYYEDVAVFERFVRTRRNLKGCW